MVRITLAVCLAALFAFCAFGDEKVYRVGGDVSAPQILEKVEPEYTPAAKAEGIEGMVVLTGEISTEGRPENIKVEKSLRSDLDTNAVDALKRWKFKPGEKDGKPVRVRATFEINFRLK